MNLTDYFLGRSLINIFSQIFYFCLWLSSLVVDNSLVFYNQYPPPPQAFQISEPCKQDYIVLESPFQVSKMLE